ncbi:DUF4350 domain-containing protein [Paracrocinitomix mangrovi]|uniref:DUF4350 domain-containing protein n=1 Tax=Paracrocinitomix mangrovi TaxID=2862509 RepID=UPI001C8D7EEE|nr:DUF4350 domain-containing protein [Paracrocinitomix mangrovi]UKN00433.1 DUF4350 domain-containing protein [Paracrocinitomix mangrovi]
MSKWTKIGIVGVVVIGLILLLYFFGFNRSNNDKVVIDDWSMTYNPSDKGPYGTYVMKELLDTVGLFGNFIQITDGLEEELEDDPDVNDIYFFIGQTNHMADSSVQYLLEFVEKGNTAFIAATNFPEELEYEFFLNSYEVMDDEPAYDSIQYLKFYHPDLSAKRYEFKYIYQNELVLMDWEYFDTNNFDLPMNQSPVVLGANTLDQPNYVKIKYGEGYIFLNSLPYCFTNICMLKRDGFNYAERVLEHIPPGRVQWDRYWLRSHSSYSSNDGGGGRSREERRRSILQFITDNPPILWATLLLIAGAILYAIFKGKRMQKLIPAAELKQNTSLEYINTLSSLYMQQGSHSKLIALKEKTFLNFIAERYYMITHKPDEKFIGKLAVKSQIDKETIGNIFELFDQLEGRTQVSDDQLIELHKRIEYFYKNCR